MKGWFTISNIKCGGQNEVDLLAVDVSSASQIKRYHIESGISISGGFSRLTTNPFSEEALKQRLSQAGQRRTLGYFTDRKFSAPGVVEKLRGFGFEPGRYEKIIVSWGWREDVPVAAKAAGVTLWDLRELLQQLVGQAVSRKSYAIDDTLRTLQLVGLAFAESGRTKRQNS